MVRVILGLNQAHHINMQKERENIGRNPIVDCERNCERQNEKNRKKWKKIEKEQNRK